jgi:hypothetical protein
VLLISPKSDHLVYQLVSVAFDPFSYEFSEAPWMEIAELGSGGLFLQFLLVGALEVH